MLFIPLSALALVIALVGGFTDTSGPVAATSLPTYAELEPVDNTPFTH